MFVVDTNVLVYAANASCPEHQRCRAWLEQWRRQQTAWYVTWGVLYGFLRLVTHPRVLPRPWKFVDALRASPLLDILTETERQGEIVTELLSGTPALAGNLISDL